jgi:hypothetical protein
MKKVISCFLVVAVLGCLAALAFRAGPQPARQAATSPGQGSSAAGSGKVDGKSPLPRLLLGAGAAVAMVLPVGCGGGKGPTTPPPPRSFTVGLSREAVFSGSVGGAGETTVQHEITAGSAGILEATLTTDRQGSAALLRAVSPSGQVVESGPGGRTLRVPAEAGRWTLTVAASGRQEAVGYRLHVVFP